MPNNNPYEAPQLVESEIDHKSGVVQTQHRSTKIWAISFFSAMFIIQFFPGYVWDRIVFSNNVSVNVGLYNIGRLWTTPLYTLAEFWGSDGHENQGFQNIDRGKIAICNCCYLISIFAFAILFHRRRKLTERSWLVSNFILLSALNISWPSLLIDLHDGVPQYGLYIECGIMSLFSVWGLILVFKHKTDS
jgi:hypothetical protein